MTDENTRARDGAGDIVARLRDAQLTVASRGTDDYDAEAYNAIADAAAELERLNAIFGQAVEVMKRADCLTHGELCEEIELVLSGLPALHTMHLMRERDAMRAALEDIRTTFGEGAGEHARARAAAVLEGARDF